MRHVSVDMSKRNGAIGTRVHSGPMSPDQGALEPNNVTDFPRTVHSIRHSSAYLAGSRLAQ